MTSEWKAAFRYAASLADSLELELAIAPSPGWSETGGPWVEPRDGMKKVVWSETVLARRTPVLRPVARSPMARGNTSPHVVMTDHTGPRAPAAVIEALV